MNSTLDLIKLNDKDILDEYENGNWVLLNVDEKSSRISSGCRIHIRDRKALVDELMFGQRENRLALRVTFLN